MAVIKVKGLEEGYDVCEGPEPSRMTLEQTCTLSVAVSLKRIADALNSANAYGEVGFEAISGNILRGLRGG